MPLYEYKCEKCQEKFELLVRRDTEVTCPQCGDPHPSKQFSSFAVSAGGSSLPIASSPGPCGSCGHPDGPGSCAFRKG